MTHVWQSVGLQIHVCALLLACLHFLTKRAKKAEICYMCYVFKSYMRHCDKNEAISAFAMLGALFKQSAEEEARICDKGVLGGKRGDLESGSGCDVEYSDGGGWIQLTLFQASSFFAAFASFLKHMGREKKVKSRQWLGEGKQKRRGKIRRIRSKKRPIKKEEEEKEVRKTVKEQI